MKIENKDSNQAPPNILYRYKTHKEAPIILERNINLPYQKLPKIMQIEKCTTSSPLLYLYDTIELSINPNLLKAKVSLTKISLIIFYTSNRIEHDKKLQKKIYFSVQTTNAICI